MLEKDICKKNQCCYKLDFKFKKRMDIGHQTLTCLSFSLITSCGEWFRVGLWRAAQGVVKPVRFIRERLGTGRIPGCVFGLLQFSFQVVEVVSLKRPGIERWLLRRILLDWWACQWPGVNSRGGLGFSCCKWMRLPSEVLRPLAALTAGLWQRRWRSGCGVPYTLVAAFQQKLVISIYTSTKFSI